MRAPLLLGPVEPPALPRRAAGHDDRHPPSAQRPGHVEVARRRRDAARPCRRRSRRRGPPAVRASRRRSRFRTAACPSSPRSVIARRDRHKQKRLFNREAEEALESVLVLTCAPDVSDAGSRPLSSPVPPPIAGVGDGHEGAKRRPSSASETGERQSSAGRQGLSTRTGPQPLRFQRFTRIFNEGGRSRSPDMTVL